MPARVARHTGNSDDLRIAVRTGNQPSQVEACPAGQRVGRWLIAMLAARPAAMKLVDEPGTDAFDPFGTGYVQATTPHMHADAVPIVHMLLDGGQAP